MPGVLTTFQRLPCLHRAAHCSPENRRHEHAAAESDTNVGGRHKLPIPLSISNLLMLINVGASANELAVRRRKKKQRHMVCAAGHPATTLQKMRPLLRLNRRIAKIGQIHRTWHPWACSICLLSSSLILLWHVSDEQYQQYTVTATPAAAFICCRAGSCGRVDDQTRGWSDDGDKMSAASCFGSGVWCGCVGGNMTSCFLSAQPLYYVQHAPRFLAKTLPRRDFPRGALRCGAACANGLHIMG